MNKRSIDQRACQPVVRAKLLNRTKIDNWSHARLTTWLISTQCVQCVLLFLVLVVNSAPFCILRSYLLLLKSPVLMRSCIPVQFSAYSFILVKYSAWQGGTTGLEYWDCRKLPFRVCGCHSNCRTTCHSFICLVLYY